MRWPNLVRDDQSNLSGAVRHAEYPDRRGARYRRLRIEEMIIHSGTAKVDLTCSLRAHAGGGFWGELEYATNVFGSTAVRWVEAFTTLLADAVARPSVCVDELALLSTAGQRRTVSSQRGV